MKKKSNAELLDDIHGYATLLEGKLRHKYFEKGLILNKAEI